MTFKINGQIILPPTEFMWTPRRPLDIQGDNRPIYPPIRSAELRYDIVTYYDWEAFQKLWQGIAASGVYVVQLPAFPFATGTAFGYREYSGVTMAEPIMGPLFAEQYPSRGVLLITNIFTG